MLSDWYLLKLSWNAATKAGGYACAVNKWCDHVLGGGIAEQCQMAEARAKNGTTQLLTASTSVGSGKSRCAGCIVLTADVFRRCKSLALYTVRNVASTCFRSWVLELNRTTRSSGWHSCFVFGRFGLPFFQSWGLLGSYTTLRKASISFIMSVRPAFRMGHLCSWDGFSGNCTFILENCRENSSFIKIWQELRVLHMKANTYFWSYPLTFS